MAADSLVGGVFVVGTDGSHTATLAVEAATQLARMFGASLHIVSAYRPVPKYRLREEREEAPTDIQWEINPSEDAEVLLEQVADELKDEAIEVHTHALEEDPAEALLQVAEQQQARLIVVGHQGVGGSHRFLLGSVPSKVSHHAACSVLIVRPD